jgi:hypothetical protein
MDSIELLLLLNRIVTAGNAITAFSFLLYALTFNLKERVARTFALLMALVTWVYLGDVLAGTTANSQEVEMWLRLQWLGIGFLPAVYVHLSDALLEVTGRPSRGRRRLAVLASYLLGAASVAAVAFSDLLAGRMIPSGAATFLQPGPLFPSFGLFFLMACGFAGLNFWRAYNRCLTRASRRRMVYLMIGSIGPILASWPFLMMGGKMAADQPHLFWISLLIITMGVTWMLVLMAYSIAYYGVTIPDRVVKARLFQWILRGPVVASTVLAIMVVTNRVAMLMGLEDSRLVPMAMVFSLLLLQHFITLVRRPIERIFFYGQDRADVTRLQLLEERLLTTGDLKQFLESALNAFCDLTGISAAFVAVMGEEGLELEVAVGEADPLRGGEELPAVLLTERRVDFEGVGTIFIWDSYWLLPLRAANEGEVAGLLGMRARTAEPDFTPEELAILAETARRVSIAINDRLLQREVFATVDRLVPEVEAIHRMRAAGRYMGAASLETLSTEGDLVQWVRAALGHYWGGPRLTESPLLRLRVVRQAMDEHEGNPVNALRAILRQAIERVRPEGERRFTGEWILYNILEMKFLQGRKVRDIAMRLAVSEADLYRKQRIAIEAVAKAIAEMERQAANQETEVEGEEQRGA